MLKRAQKASVEAVVEYPISKRDIRKKTYLSRKGKNITARIFAKIKKSKNSYPWCMALLVKTTVKKNMLETLLFTQKRSI